MDTKCKYILFALFLLINFPVAANHIAYPWRAAPVIVKAGEHIEILYNNLKAMPIKSIVLEGPYNKVDLPEYSLEVGNFIYDTYTDAATNNRLIVKIPDMIPEELYDLKIKCDGETTISRRSVKVVKEYHTSYCFLHISDLHLSRQWVGNVEDGYAKELELLDKFIDIANIINPEFTIVTGDIIHDYTRFDADSLGWGGTTVTELTSRPLVEEKYKNYFEGAKNYKGVYGFNSPVFSVTGNHDFYGLKKEDHMGKASQWNRLMGKRVYGFSYHDTRIIVADDFLGDPVTDIPDQSPMSGLQGKVLSNYFEKEGPGKLRIMAQHRPDRFDNSFIKKHDISLILNGHSHRPYEEFLPNSSILSIRPGTICKSGEIEKWEEVLGFFRLFYVHGDTYEYTKPLRFCKNPTLPYDELELNLTLHFENENNGQYSFNKAEIKNLFDIDLPNCNIRFIMQKGEYIVSDGLIYQTIETEVFSIIDIKVDISAGEEKNIEISKKW